MAIVICIATAKLVLHLLTAGSYGYFVDELYFLACAEHLDFGYVDLPPFVTLVAAAERSWLGDSLLAVRFLPAVAGALKVVLTGLIVRELGGKRVAQGLAALAVAIATVYLSIDHLLTMNVFEPLFWMGCALVLIRMIKTRDARLWLWFGVLAGLGLENKDTMVFFGLAAVLALLLTAERKLLLDRWVPIAGVVALAILLPNLLWQIEHGFPHLEQLANVRRNQRNVTLSPIPFFLEQVLLLHPFSFPI